MGDVVISRLEFTKVLPSPPLWLWPRPDPPTPWPVPQYPWYPPLFGGASLQFHDSDALRRETARNAGFDKVINPLNKEWGIGQVQSIINSKVTVNFENVGKKVINAEYVKIEKIDK